MERTAPVTALRLHQRAAVCERMHWTFDQYDAQRAGDIAFLLDYWAMNTPMTEHKATTDGQRS